MVTIHLWTSLCMSLLFCVFRFLFVPQSHQLLFTTRWPRLLQSQEGGSCTWADLAHQVFNSVCYSHFVCEHEIGLGRLSENFKNLIYLDHLDLDLLWSDLLIFWNILNLFSSSSCWAPAELLLSSWPRFERSDKLRLNFLVAVACASKSAKRVKSAGILHKLRDCHRGSGKGPKGPKGQWCALIARYRKAPKISKVARAIAAWAA